LKTVSRNTPEHAPQQLTVAEIAWAQKGIKPVDVPDGSFQYTKLSAAGDFFNWGLIELRAEQMKRTKNSRKMHMVFNVQSGAVEVKVHENEFTVHRGGIWQVPRGMLLLFSFSRFLLFSSYTRTAAQILINLGHDAVIDRLRAASVPFLCRTVLCCNFIAPTGSLHFRTAHHRAHPAGVSDAGLTAVSALDNYFPASPAAIHTV
jgi:hypothetical protein